MNEKHVTIISFGLASIPVRRGPHAALFTTSRIVWNTEKLSRRRHILVINSAFDRHRQWFISNAYSSSPLKSVTQIEHSNDHVLERRRSQGDSLLPVFNLIVLDIENISEFVRFSEITKSSLPMTLQGHSSVVCIFIHPEVNMLLL